MKKLACVYTAGGGMPQVMEKVFESKLGQIRFNHISDSGMMRDLIADGGVTESTERRLLKLFDAAVGTDPDMVICTCSSIGEVAERAQAAHPEVKILRIDEAMALYAVEHYERIAVIATVETTVGPSCRLLERLAADLGKEISVVSGTAAEAFPLLLEGKKGEALRYIREKAVDLCGEADILLLAQASMCVFAEELSAATGKPVIGSPELCAQEVAELLR